MARQRDPPADLQVRGGVEACQRLLPEREDTEVASANTAVRAARRLGWLSDEEAEPP
jgi:hypothetical protein